ncbi:MAG: hypothetical protein KJO77_09375, partial [Bacteroidia bacterium]|nr:hypothetical protein [Bacteroidia bacterium]
IENFKTILIVVIIAGALGFGMEKIMPERYDSTMLVRTYFDAKYQLYTNLKYYNALIKDENYATLAAIFNVDEGTMMEVKEFEMGKGPESENDKMQQYDAFVRSLDSSRAQDIDYQDFINNRGIFSGDIFEIRVEATRKDIFKSLEEGVNNSFNNLYSVKKMQQRDSMITIRRNNILRSIAEMDSLQNVYINVLEEESQATRAKISLGEGFPLQQEKSNTKEYQLLNKEIELRDELRQMDEEKVEEDEFFKVMSTFQEVGNKVNKISSKYSLVFPALAFILLCLVYLTKNYIRFVKNYER